MSTVTKTLHRKNYPAIDAASPEQSQAGRKILITGASSTAIIGNAAARAFITAQADTLVITSRSIDKVKDSVRELQELPNCRTRILGYRLENCDTESVNELWQNLAQEGIEIDVLVLNATQLVSTIAEGMSSLDVRIPTLLRNEYLIAADYTLASLFPSIDESFKNQCIHVDHFRQQSSAEGKVLLYISTNATHFQDLPLEYSQATVPRIAMNRALSDLAGKTPVDKMQILCIHPGFVFTHENEQRGYNPESLPVPFDDSSLPANFYVWASTKKAAFLHGRFLWTNWDVEELVAMKSKFENDHGFLRMGLQGIESQTFEMLLTGMGRSV